MFLGSPVLHLWPIFSIRTFHSLWRTLSVPSRDTYDKREQRRPFKQPESLKQDTGTHHVGGWLHGPEGCKESLVSVNDDNHLGLSWAH